MKVYIVTKQTTLGGYRYGVWSALPSDLAKKTTDTLCVFLRCPS